MGTVIPLPLLAVALAMAGCGGGGDRRVEVAGGPQLSTPEGVAIEAAISIAPASGDRADRLDCADLDMSTADPAAAAQIDLRCAAGDVQPVLVATPRCDVVAVGGQSAVIPIEVRAPGLAGVAPATVALQVVANDGEACLPSIGFRYAPSGLCVPPQPDDRPLDADRGHSLLLMPGEGGALCADVTSLDPAVESLWLRTSTTAPSTLVTLPPPTDAVTAHTLAFPIAANPGVVGLFDVEVSVFRTDPDAPSQGGEEFVPAATDASAALSIGGRDAGVVAVELVGRDLAAPIDVAEFGVADVAMRVWRVADAPGTDGYCVRARRTTDVMPQDPSRSFLTVGTADGALVVGDSEALCLPYEADPTQPALLSLRVAPPVDAAATETVDVEVGVLTGAGAGDFAVVTRVTLAVADRAEDLPCAELDPDERAVVACADVDADGEPELLVATRIADACGYTRGAGGYTPLIPDPAFTPRAVIAFSWDDAGTTRDVIVGQAVDRTLRALDITGAAQMTWIPEPALSLPADPPVGLSEVTPVAEAVGAPATHFAYAAVSGARGVIHLQSISDGGTGTGSGQIADVPIAGAVERVYVAPADLDGDGANELLFFAVSDLSDARPTLEVIAIQTPSFAASVSCNGLALCAPYASPIELSDDIAASAAVSSSSLSGPQTLYAITADQSFDASILGFSADLLGPSILVAPGPALSLAALGNRLFAALASGVYELIPGVAWKPQDPVVRQSAPAGEIPLVQPGYGQGIAECLGGPPALVFPVSDQAVRYTEIDVAVDIL